MVSELATPRTSPKRLWPAIAKWCFLAVVGFLLVLANVPGQEIVVQTKNSLDARGYEHVAKDSPHFIHGWPCTYLERESSYWQNQAVGSWLLSPPTRRQPSPWPLTSGALRLDVFSLTINIVVAAGILYAAAAFFDRRRRHGILKFTLADAAVLCVLVGIFFASVAVRLRGREADLVGLETIKIKGNAPWTKGDWPRGTWESGAPSWLVHFWDRESLHRLDRVVSIDLDANELDHASKLSALRSIHIMRCASNENLRSLEQCPELLILDMDRINLAFSYPPRAAERDTHHFQIPRLANLRVLKVYQTAFRGEGLENLPRLVYLDAAYTQLDDRAMASLGQMRNLKLLRLHKTRVTDEGLRHLRESTDLQHLELSDTAIGDAGVAHLGKLRKLQILELTHTQTTDASCEVLSGLQELKMLGLPTSISSTAMEKLQRSLPKCEIRLGPLYPYSR